METRYAQESPSPSASITSIVSIDSGYESLNDKFSHGGQDFILIPCHSAYEAATSDSADGVKKPFQFVCKGKLKEDGQWGCGLRFARADALGRHFRSETGRLCLKPLLDEEWSERHDYRQDEQRTKHDLLKNEELGSADLVDISRHCNIPAATLAHYPALAKIRWIELPLVDDGFDGRPSISDFENYSDTDADDTTLQPSIKEGSPEEPAAINPSKEPDTKTEGDCAAKICEISLPKGSTDASIKPSFTSQINEQDHLTFDNKDQFPLSATSSNDNVDIRSKLPDDPAKPCISVLAQVSEQADDSVREPRSINKNMCTESLSRVQVSDDYNHFTAASTTESDFEDSQTSENETISSEASSESSFISQVLEAHKREAVESLMTEFKSLLDHRLGVRSRATSTESSTSSSSPRFSAEQPYQGSGDGRDKQKERDDDGSGSSREGGDDDQNKTSQVEGPLRDFSPRKFACPYYRRNSQKHKKHRSCAGPGWVSVHRVKEHVFRQHCLLIHCHRCGTIFKTDSALTAHQRLPQGCEVKVVELPEGCSKEQEKLLRKRKRGVGSEEDKWRDMFKCLFPDTDEDMIPTPYYDYEQATAWESRRDDEFAHYEQYLGRELPRVVRRRLEEVVSESARPFESQLRSQLVDIVRDAQSALFRSYRQSNIPQSSFPTEQGSETDHAQTDSFNSQAPPLFDFSAFFAPPPVADSYSNPVGVDISASLLEDSARGYQPTLDSGYGSNNMRFNVSGGMFEDCVSNPNGKPSTFFNSEAAPPPTSQESSYQTLDHWFQ